MAATQAACRAVVQILERPVDEETNMATLIEAWKAERDMPMIIEDVYSAVVTNPDVLTVDDACKAFFETTPEWLRQVMRIRNRIVAKLGFGAGDNTAPEVPDVIEVGQNFSAFEVLDRSDDEIIMGGDDDRIAMRISIRLDNDGPERLLHLETAAHAFDAVGRGYLTLVNLGHGPLARRTAERMAGGVAD